MEVVLMDKFVVPEESKEAFLEAIRKSSAFLRTLPGFVEGFVYEKREGESRHNVVTTAVWQNENTFQNARQSAVEGFQKIGFNPPEIMKNLRVQWKGPWPPLALLRERARQAARWWRSRRSVRKQCLNATNLMTWTPMS